MALQVVADPVPVVSDVGPETAWRSSGYRLLEPTPDDRLMPGPDFVRAFLLRPELVPVEESCRAEQNLHAALMASPFRPVGGDDLAALADPDARDNYSAFLVFRSRLESAGTIEAAYLDLVYRGLNGVPPLFLDQLAHVLVRHLLRDAGDPFRYRAGEVLFRTQKVTIKDGRVLLADREVVDMLARDGGAGGLGKLLIEAETPLREVELDVLTEASAAGYWDRSDRFDTVLDLTFGAPGLDARCRVLEAWIDHLAGVTVRIQPVRRIDDERWTWHVGLDAEASQILNALYDGREPDQDALDRLLALFRLTFEEPRDMADAVRGRPVHLALAMTPAGALQLKPQNLIANLPLARRV